jgi:ABC-type multidrug transport system fused ATPase/permease subunit
VRKLLEKWFNGYRVASRFFVDLNGFRGTIFVILFLSFVLAGLEVLRPWTISWVVDYALNAKTKVKFGQHVLFKVHLAHSTVIWISGATMVLIAVGGALLDFATDSMLSTVSSGVARSMRYRIFTHDPAVAASRVTSRATCSCPDGRRPSSPMLVDTT